MRLEVYARTDFRRWRHLNIQWKAEADFLTEPYKGSDAYETHDGLMVAMVSTFKGADLKLKTWVVDRRKTRITGSESIYLSPLAPADAQNCALRYGGARLWRDSGHAG